MDIFMLQPLPSIVITLGWQTRNATQTPVQHIKKCVPPLSWLDTAPRVSEVISSSVSGTSSSLHDPGSGSVSTSGSIASEAMPQSR